MEKMPWDEFCNLLSGLKEDTPLIRMALIRKETDPERIKNFTEEQKEINREWRTSVRERYRESMTQEDVEARYKKLSSLLDGNVKR